MQFMYVEALSASICETIVLAGDGAHGGDLICASKRS
jgi:hypothetical protein